MEAPRRNLGRCGERGRQEAVAAVEEETEAMAATGGTTALWAAICSSASFRSFLRIRI